MPRIARGLEGKKINLVIAVARAKDRARARGEKIKPIIAESPLLLAEGKKINLADGAQWQSKRVGSELGQGFEVKPSIGHRSSGDRSDWIKLHSFVLVLPKKGRFGLSS